MAETGTGRPCAHGPSWYFGTTTACRLPSSRGMLVAMSCTHRQSPIISGSTNRRCKGILPRLRQLACSSRILTTSHPAAPPAVGPGRATSVPRTVSGNAYRISETASVARLRASVRDGGRRLHPLLLARRPSTRVTENPRALLRPDTGSMSQTREQVLEPSAKSLGSKVDRLTPSAPRHSHRYENQVDRASTPVWPRRASVRRRCGSPSHFLRSATRQVYSRPSLMSPIGQYL